MQSKVNKPNKAGCLALSSLKGLTMPACHLLNAVHCSAGGSRRLSQQRLRPCSCRRPRPQSWPSCTPRYGCLVASLLLLLLLLLLLCMIQLMPLSRTTPLPAYGCMSLPHILDIVTLTITSYRPGLNLNQGSSASMLLQNSMCGHTEVLHVYISP